MGALREAGRQGRGGDTRLAHVTKGDIVFPAERIDEPTRAMIFQFMKQKGIRDPHRFQVGHPANSKNPKTRLAEFAEGGGTGAGGPGDSGDSGDAGGVGNSGVGSGIGGAPGPGGIGSTGSGSPSGTTGEPDSHDVGHSIGATSGVAPGDTSATGSIGTAGLSGGLTGTESTTAVESGTIPGTPVGTPEQNSVIDAGRIGVLGQFGQPNVGVLNGILNGVLKDPLGTLGDIGIGLIGGLPAAIIEGLSRGFTGQGLAGNISGALGLGGNPPGLNGVLGNIGSDPATGPAPPGTNDTGAGLRALGGGVGVNLDEMLRNRLGTSIQA